MTITLTLTTTILQTPKANTWNEKLCLNGLGLELFVCCVFYCGSCCYCLFSVLHDLWRFVVIVIVVIVVIVVVVVVIVIVQSASTVCDDFSWSLPPVFINRWHRDSIVMTMRIMTSSNNADDNNSNNNNDNNTNTDNDNFADTQG